MKGVVAWVMVGLAACAAATYALSFPLNHDVGWWLYLADAMLQGEGLYTSFVEVNPPLYGYLAVIPAGIASILSLPIEPVFEVSVLALIFTIVIWTMREVSSGGSLYLHTTLGLSLLLGYVVMPGNDFGQREHLMLVLVTPYAILAWRRLEGMNVRSLHGIAAGLAAGLGFGFKPYFVLTWLGLELMLAFATRSLRVVVKRPELSATACFLSLYALLVIIVYPEYLELLWNAREVYSRFNAHDRLELALSPMIFLAVTMGAAWTIGGAGARLARVFAVLMSTMWVLAVAQRFFRRWSLSLDPTGPRALPSETTPGRLKQCAAGFARP